MPIVYEVSEEMLQESVRRIVAAGFPEKIVLFGSRARRDWSPESDLDLLVIDDAATDDTRRRYYEAARSLPMPVDLIVRTPSEVASWRNVSNHFLTKIIREGRVLYERRTDLIRESVPPKDQTDHAREFMHSPTSIWKLQPT